MRQRASVQFVRWGVLAGTVLLSSALLAQNALPAGVVRVASVEGITEYRLENGLRVLLLPDPSKRIITVNIVYQVGSRHEDYGETGMAHLIEHLMSIGSERHPDAKKEQSDRGAQRNASTWFDRTNYYETFPASDDNLAWAIDLESDRMFNASIRRDLLNSQMSVVRNEFEIGENNPAGVLEERVFSTAFLWHNYGKSTIGTKTDIERVPIEKLQSFYRTYYRPDNAVLIVAGRFEEGRALQLIAEKFGPLTSPTAPVPATYTEEPVQDGERTVTLRRAGDVQRLAVGYHIPAAAHPDTAAMEMVADALTSAPSGRLYKALVETKLATSVSADVSLLREAGLVLFNAGVRKEVPLDRVRDALLAEVDRLVALPLTTEEIERSRARLLKNFDLPMAESNRQAMALTEWVAAGDWRLMFLNRDRLRRVSATDVQAAALKYFKPSNRTVGQFIPDDAPARADVPAAPSLTELLRDYKGDAAVATGEAFDPTPDNIERRVVRRLVSNRMQLVVLPKKNRGGTVVAALRLDYGDEQSLKGQAAASDAVRQMLMRGSTTRTRQQIQDELTRLKADVSVSGSVSRTQVLIRTVAPNLPDVVRLIGEILREPAFAATEFEEMRQLALASVEAIRMEPDQLAAVTLQRTLTPFEAGDARGVRTPDEQIADLKALTLERVKEFHRRFYAPSNAALAVVGDVAPEPITTLVSQLLSAWPASAAQARLVRPYSATTATSSRIDTPDKANAVLTAGMSFAAGDEHADYPALVIANYMLGGHSKSRLYERIRGQEGLSYSVSSQLAATSGETRSSWTFVALTNPVNIGKAEAAFRDEINTALTRGFDAAEVDAAKQGYLQSRQVQRTDDATVAQRLAVLAYDNRTMTFDESIEQRIQALSVAQINDAVRRHLDASRLAVFRAGDFSKTP